jgi:hypothetical protein
LVYFTTIWSILWPFGLFCSHSVYFLVIWHIFLRLDMLHQEKSGYADFESKTIDFS